MFNILFKKNETTQNTHIIVHKKSYLTLSDFVIRLFVLFYSYERLCKKKNYKNSDAAGYNGVIKL